MARQTSGEIPAGMATPFSFLTDPNMGGGWNTVPQSFAKRGLQEDLVGTLPLSEVFSRTRWARELDLDVIEFVLRSINVGIMAPYSDLLRESLRNAPAVSGMVFRRIEQVSGAGYEFIPAEGTGEDDKARDVADLVRRWISKRAGSFEQLLADLMWAEIDGRAASQIDWVPVVGDEVRWAIDDFTWIHPGRLSFGRQRELRVVERYRQTGIYYSVGPALGELPDKFIEHIPRIWGDYPEREGIGPMLLYWLFFQRYAWRERMELIELFSKGWRIVTADGSIDSYVSPSAVTDGRIEAEKLGGETNTASFAPGVGFKVEWPHPEAGRLHQMTPEDVKAELAQLILGQSRTTDGDTYGKGGEVMKGEQDIIKRSGGRRLSRVITERLIRPFVRLNVGRNAEHLVPTFRLLTDPPKDALAAQKRLSGALKDGVTVTVAQYREEVGIRSPKEGEAFLVLDRASANDRGRIIDPSAEGYDPSHEKMVGALDVKPEAVEAVMRVDELRASKGAGPWEKGGGGDGDLPVTTFRAKQTVDAAAVAAAELGQTKPTDPNPPEAAAPAAKPASGRPGGQGGTGGAGPRKVAAEAGSSVDEDRSDAIVDRGTREGAKITGAWAAHLVAACRSATTPEGMHRALSDAAAGLDLEKLSKSLERQLCRGVMLGALEAVEDADQLLEHPPARPVMAELGAGEVLMLGGLGATGGIVDFVAKPFVEAIKWFTQKKVVPKAQFERMRGEAKKEAFTIAGLAKKKMLETGHEELANVIKSGADLRTFDRDLAARFASNGWLPLKPSHTEVIYRNGVMGSYGAGRLAQMRQPEVMKARPVWVVRGVDDARTRPEHRKAHGKAILATDGVWDDKAPPWGHNCRCRLVSASMADVHRLGLTLTTGASLGGLPDEGWDSPA